MRYMPTALSLSLCVPVCVGVVMLDKLLVPWCSHAGVRIAETVCGMQVAPVDRPPLR